MTLVKVPFLGTPVFDIAHMGERVMLIRFKTIIRSMIFDYFLSLKMIIVKVPFSGSPIIDTSPFCERKSACDAPQKFF